MEKESPGSGRVFHAKVDGSGRVVLPAGSRLRQTAKDGAIVVLIEDDQGCLQISTMEAAVKGVQDYYSKLIPAGVSLVDELIAERREEAARE